MSALTLVEAIKLALNNGEVKRAAVIGMFAQASDILRALPFKTIAGNAYSYNREGALPSVAFRGVNGSFTPSTGVINPLTEALRICGGELDVDTFIVSTQGDTVRSAHEALKAKAIAAEITRVFFKGDSESDPTEFDGLQKRITGAQLIDAGSTNGGDPLSLAKLDELIDATTNPTHLLMSKAMRRRLTQASRATSVGGFITFEQDEFGRQVAFYGGLPILVPYSDNGGTEPLAFDEVGAGGATATATSIYCVGMGDGLVSGLQNKPMEVRDLGEIDEKPVYRTRVEWYAGLCIEHGRAASRLRGISNAAVVA
jgi:hypothetical protein